MECPRCQREMGSDARFCDACGQLLPVACSSCGRSNAPDARFCKACGGPIAASDAERTQALRTISSAREAERRQITVMFCDLAGSTALSERLDPEELREVIRGYQQACADVIHHFDGHIAQYLGDGLLVYFGYPQAHEDDPQRAVHAGLGIIEAIELLPAGVDGNRLAVRIGIHTGVVVVGEVGGGSSHEQLALGETPNVAARLQALADSGRVVVSAATHRLVEGFFLTRDLGPQALTGTSASVRVFEVTGESAARSRLDVAAPAGLTPLVGREQEVGLLLDRWEQAVEGHGQVVLLTGEPGIGKSRLVQVVKQRVAGGLHTRWECRCSPYHQDSALYPMIDLFQRALQFQREETAAEKVHKIEAALARYDLVDPEAIAVWVSLLSLPSPKGSAPLNLTLQQQRQKTLEAILALLLALTTREPVLFIVEDLHWVDPSTLDLLTLVLDQVATMPVLVVLTFRPDFHLPWASRAHLTHLTISRFTRKQTELMVERVTTGKPLPAEVVEQVVTRTDGVPLFIEELTKMVLESGLLRENDGRYVLAGPLPSLAIPVTLQDSLMARLDRLESAKSVAQLGATIGRDFSYELLSAVSTADDVNLERHLAQLVDADLLHARGVMPNAAYTFKHALIQETAYQSLLRSVRQHYHRRIAQVLEERFPDTSASQPELVAHHYTQAGLSEPAIPHWVRAGQRAIQHSANAEAISHLTKAIDLIGTLDESPTRIQQELQLRVLIALPLTLIQGWGAPAVGAAYQRAAALCDQLGATPQLLPTLVGVFTYYLVRGQFRMADELALRNVQLAQQSGDPKLIIETELDKGSTSFYMGRFEDSLRHMERVSELYDPSAHHDHVFIYGHDPGVVALVHASLAAWFLGYADRALDHVGAGATLSQRSAHPFSRVWFLIGEIVVRQWRGEVAHMREIAEAAIAQAREHGFPHWMGQGLTCLGWILVCEGRAAEGIDKMRQGLAIYRQTGAELFRPYLLGLLADGHARAGAIAQASAAVEEALAQVERTEERCCEAELHRLRGELLLRQGSSGIDMAESCFRQALAIARRQTARSLELRAATSLARLWRARGRGDEAYAFLAPVYKWFREGLNTQTLVDARSLLNELATPQADRRQPSKG